MNLKEAFHYQNALKSWIEPTECFLMEKNNVVKRKEIHKKNLVNSEIKNPEIKESTNRKMDVEPNDIINFLYDLIIEKNKVSKAISEAKRSLEMDLDCEIEITQSKQRLARIYKDLANCIDTERTKQNKAFKTNTEGSKIPYFYEVDEIITMDYNKIKVRELQEKLETESDAMSTKIEALQLNTEVNHTPKYDVNDSFENLVSNLYNK